jgi:hypothetical protein
MSRSGSVLVSGIGKTAIFHDAAVAEAAIQAAGVVGKPIVAIPVLCD